MQAQHPLHHALDTEDEGRQPFIKIGEKPSIDLAIDELSTVGRTMEAHLQSKIWQNIPLLLRDWNSSVDENKKKAIFDRIHQILQYACDNQLKVLNRRLFLSSLEIMLANDDLPKSLKSRGELCRDLLGYVDDSSMILVEDEEYTHIAQSIRTREMDEMNEKQKIPEQKSQIKKLEAYFAQLKERTTLKSQNDELKQQLADLPIWVGTDSLQTLDRTAHRLTPTTLTQIIKLEASNWKTAFTLPIDEGEWELKIRASLNTFWSVRLGFLRHPLPQDATQKSCGSWNDGIGGHFVLWDGRMWKEGEFKPVGTNKKCDRVGQTAAIRVNMSTKEARLFVDDEEQPGIFPDIPSPLCLGISTGYQIEDKGVEVLWLKRRRS